MPLTGHHVVARVRYFSTEEGGRETVITAQWVGALFEVDGEYFDCRLDVTELAPWGPGDEQTVRVYFLCPENVLPRLVPGSRFRLREGRDVAEGEVLALEGDALRPPVHHSEYEEGRRGRPG